jgi:hypothetical protein
MIHSIQINHNTKVNASANLLPRLKDSYTILAVAQKRHSADKLWISMLVHTAHASEFYLVCDTLACEAIALRLLQARVDKNHPTTRSSVDGSLRCTELPVPHLDAKTTTIGCP